MVLDTSLSGAGVTAWPGSDGPTRLQFLQNGHQRAVGLQSRGILGFSGDGFLKNKNQRLVCSPET